MGLAVAQQLSPELVLVCPDLRAQALELLPAVDPDALFEVAPRAKPTLALVPTPAPQPRARPLAVVAYVVEAVVLGSLRGAAMVAAIAVLAFLLAR